MPAGPGESIWPLDPHTLAKHEILRRYLGAWFPIMSSGSRRIVFFDGFAGPGIYAGGEIGSPVIALKTLIEHRYFNSFGHDREFIFLFCEADKARHASLCAQLAAYKETLGGSWPAGVKVQAAGDSFAATADDMLNYLDEKGARLAPTFAFVDPFGVTGLPMATLARLVKAPKCELFVNMMINTAKRFATSGIIDKSLEELFGTTRFTEAEGLTGEPRIRFLHDLYAEQLQTVAGMDHVQSFRMINRQGHATYFLFYATRSVSGVKAMKAAMWKADPAGSFTFADKLAGQDVFFTEENVDVGPLRKELLAVFAGTQVSIDLLENYVLINTPYRETHLRRPVLTPWEKQGVIEVTRPPAGRQFVSGTLIKFPTAPGPA